ncbi:carbohydrate kinase family protein [Brachyspira hyodysenteriae]|uniref:Carbohydrate kinase n=1 Tax=Brachyspira hyodysenteriae ATCC 27164 TaxID=1266923 RepID=A0A3B6WB89_BRAHO|nr:carbohydrate kinase family protein [Brachyspira hyodysenteriae]ANN64464.1 carbohydrate kinase [Brachyspira hyodysenteriae ATCC 27164]AUJ49133.1 carbohydrate kinase [Brachyspira hyodysenteriae]KLI18210.1 carbohydrate kinase [Brachyspira hyodysenteriae]KLI25526.1 carbohydrate kinase [Brachyspira hyodysenteriae]KLI27699.1 carbohydrate kinase [Brachyspira hyodysenteriae]
MKNYILSIGGSNIDIQGFSKSRILLKESNPGKIKVCTGGVERNIINNLSNIGLKNIKFITSIGNDIFGDILFNNIKSLGVDVSYIVRNGSSTSYIAIMNNDRDMEIAMSDMDTLDENINIEYLESIRDIIEDSSFITIDAVMNRDIFEYIIKNFPNKKLLTDAVSIKKSEHIKGLEKYIYALKLNSNEASFLLDRDINTIEEGKEAVKIFLEKGVKEIYITFGALGICYGTYNNINEAYYLKAPKVNIVNATGAGDAFMAGIVYSIFHDYDLDYKVKFAAVMAMFALESEETVNDNTNFDKVAKRVEDIFKIKR